MRKVLMIFLDGVGIGENNASTNTFLKKGFRTFTDIFGEIPTLDSPFLKVSNNIVMPVDAVMGIPGYPQSGTGQTSIYCGINASNLLGEHFGPYAHSTLHPVIKKENIFIKLKELGFSAYFANAYPRLYFQHLKRSPGRLGTASLCYLAAGNKLNTSVQVRNRLALTAEITELRWNEKLNYHLPVITPETAAQRLLRIAGRHSFTLFEYFLTDYIGHGRYPEEAASVHENIDRFLFSLLTGHGDELTVIVISDHGNYEDATGKRHTTNPALCMLSGRDAYSLSEQITTLADIRDSILDVVRE
ncbi:MAG: alkaline phosphatase family protein [Ignavibacteria bacterium]|nr:alkaline phosphatase family protein [Ignavibacteria bacterium]